MSKKIVSRFAAGILGAALLGMTVAMPVFADPDDPAETAAETSAEAADEQQTETEAVSTAAETAAAAEETTTEQVLDPNDPLSGIEYEETADGGIRIVK